jgi:hypothetical protein
MNPFHPVPVLGFPQGELYALELVRGGGAGKDREESLVLVGDKLLQDIAGVLSLEGEFGDIIIGKAAILGSEMTDAIESILVEVGAGDGGIILGSMSCVPVQWSVRPP